MERLVKVGTIAGNASSSALEVANANLLMLANGTLVGPSNPIPVTGSGATLSDVLLTDSTGALFIARDNGIMISYWNLNTNSVYTPTGTIQVADSLAMGTDNTGVSQPSGGLGIRGWLSALWSKVLNMTFTGAGYLNVNVGSQTFSYSQNNSTNGNSTAYSVASLSSWQGTLENTINQAYLIIGVNSTQLATVVIAQYMDAAGTIAEVPAKSFLITANTPFSTSIAIEGNYVKVVVTNTSGSTATLYVDSYYGPLPVQADSLTAGGNFKVAVQEALPSGTNQIGTTIDTDLASFQDSTTTAGYVYFLSAQPGTLVSQALWKVSRMKTSNAQVQWANGNNNYTNYGTG